MLTSEIVNGATYQSPRWDDDRKVTALVRKDKKMVVHFVKQRTGRTGNAPLETFAKVAKSAILI